MRICPNCKREVDDYDFTCPYCHKRMPPRNKPFTGHASYGNLDSYVSKVVVSNEDKNIIREKNHTSDASQDCDDVDCAQPYSFITRENGDRD